MSTPQDAPLLEIARGSPGGTFVAVTNGIEHIADLRGPRA